MAAAITRPMLRYHGGKYRLAPLLLQLFPSHNVYTEAFGGAASVLLLKPRCHAEIYNDLDREVVNVFRVMQDKRQAKELERRLKLTPYAREEFLLAYQPTRSPIEKARRTIIRSFMGFGSDSITRTKASMVGFNTRISSTMATGFRWNGNNRSVTPAHDWISYSGFIPLFCERLQGVVLENRPAVDILIKMDKPDALHYIDPPYPFSSRKVGNGTTPAHRYRHEMTDRDHERLAEVVHSLKGMVIISSYPGVLYERLYRGWQTVSWEGGQYAGGTGKAASRYRTEMVYMNDACYNQQKQARLPLA